MMAPTSPDPSNAAATVLIIDDSSENIIVLGKLLEPYYLVKAAKSGPLGLRLAQAQPKPDLILLDIMMPGMDGFEVLRTLRTTPATADIPVIFVTAMNESTDEAHGLALGAVDYISKPVQPAILLARVHTHLELKRHHDLLRRQNEILEMRVQERVEALGAILDAADQSILMVAPDGQIHAINRIGAARFGATATQLVGHGLFDLLPSDCAKAYRDKMAAVMASRQSLTFEHPLSGRIYRTTLHPALGVHDRIVIYAADITDSQAAERRFSEVVELATEGIAALDPQGVFTFANPRLHAMLGMAEGGLVGLTAERFIDPGDRAEFGARLERLRALGHAQPLQLSWQLLRADGSVFPALISTSVRTQRAPGAEADRMVLVITDISELQLVQDALQEALRVVEASPVVCFRWRAERDWPLDYISENVARWGYQAFQLLAGVPHYLDILHPEDRQALLAEMAAKTEAGAEEFDYEYRVRATDGRYFWVENHIRIRRNARGVAEYYEGVVRDIDANKRYEQELADNLAAQVALNKKLEDAQHQLLQSEKLASIGQLAAGVAHELNNPIGFVYSNMGTLNGYVKDLLEITDQFEKAAEAIPSAPPAVRQAQALLRDKDFEYLKEDIGNLIEESRDGLDRVRKIVQDLKDFSRVGDTDWQWADLHPGLESTLNIVWNELKYKATVHKDYGDIPQIRCIPSQLNQVFMNLLVNAGHAIEEKGDIALRTGREGDQVWVEVEDTGKGIAEENLTRIFDPFFTTKPVGKGTGLGLSLAYGIVTRHQGHIEVHSAVGKGTRMRVWLPIQGAGGA